MNKEEIAKKSFIHLIFFEMLLLNDLDEVCESLHKKLTCESTDILVDELVTFLNHIEYAKFLKLHGLVLERPGQFSESDRIHEREIVENNFDAFNKFNNSQLNYDDVAAMVETQLNKLLKHQS